MIFGPVHLQKHLFREESTVNLQKARFLLQQVFRDQFEDVFLVMFTCILLMFEHCGANTLKIDTVACPLLQNKEHFGSFGGWSFGIIGGNSGANLGSFWCHSGKSGVHFESNFTTYFCLDKSRFFCWKRLLSVLLMFLMEFC